MVLSLLTPPFARGQGNILISGSITKALVMEFATRLYL